MADVTFLAQTAPVDEYGRALYAVVRSVIRAMLDQLSYDDLNDINADRQDVTFRQLSKLARLERDKGMRGDGFEWAVHEAVVGQEPLVTNIVADVMGRASRYLKGATPQSLLFGHERARYLGFLDAVIENAGEQACLLPDGRGHPYAFGPWVQIAAKGVDAEPELTDRIRQIWKTDIFLGDSGNKRYVAATIKSNWELLEEGKGLRVGIVPEAPNLPRGVRRHNSLHLAVLPDPNGFMGLFNDAYAAVSAAVTTVGRHARPAYYLKPSATAQRVQQQLEKFALVKVVEIEAALNEAAQQNLVGVQHRLVSVEAPPWLHINESRTPIIAPKPSFERLD